MMFRRLALFLTLCAVVPAQAEPQYSVIFGQTCFLCHANPTGRGMRSGYGSQFYAPTYLTHKPVSAETLERLKPQLSESVTIGADLRTIFMDESTPADSIHAGLTGPYSTNTGTVAVMAASVYLGFEPSDEIELYYAQNLFNTSRFEVFGLAKVLPLHGFVKVGKFQENYGWAFADHTAYVRTGLWSDYDGGTGLVNPPTPPGFGVGGQIGLRPKSFDISASFTDNADFAYPGPQDTQKRWFARLLTQQGIQSLGLQFSAGGSWFHSPPVANAMPPYQRISATKQQAWGGFGGIGWQGIAMHGYENGFGFLTTALAFEYDRKAWTPIGSVDHNGNPVPVTSAYSTTQLSVMVHPGLWVIGAYDWLDNNQHSEDPNNAFSSAAERKSFGLQIFPVPWIDIIPMYRVYVPSSSQGHLRNIQHGELQVHFLF